MAGTPPVAPKRRWQAFGSLRYPSYRMFWYSLVAFVGGQQILQVVLAWAVYDMTGSPLYLALLGAANSIPAIAVALLGGVIADRMNRRLVLLVAMTAQAVVALGVAALALGGVLTAWHLLVAAALIGAFMGIEGPSRQAILPNLVEREDLMNAVALFSSVWQGTRIVGPFLGGLLLEAVGLATTFGIIAAAFLLGVFLLFFVRAPQLSGRAEAFLRQLVDGLDFIRRNSLFSSLIGMTFFNSFFGMSYIFLLPIFAKDIFGMGAAGMGLLMGASALGALAGTLAVAAFGKDHQRNALLMGGATLFGATLVLFANLHLLPLPQLPGALALFGIPATTTVLLALAVLAVSGSANSAYMITIQTVLQAAVPDELRGRVMGVHGLTWSLMPLGSLQGGTVANFLGAPFAVAMGGVAVIAYTVFTVARPGFRRRVVEATASSSPATAPQG